MKLLQIVFFFILSLSSAYSMPTDTVFVGKRQVYNSDYPIFKYKVNKHINREKGDDFKSMDITSHAGALSTLLGEQAYHVDSLVVRGEVDDTDIRTLWDASFNGRLSVINLKYAKIKNGIIPENAFFHQYEQLDPSGQYLSIISLRRIILPDEVRRIESCAFLYAANLEEINIPSELEYLGDCAFADCDSLKTSPLVFPEGFEELDMLAFSNCKNLKGQVVLPSTIKYIRDAAFSSSRITSINFPEGLREIGQCAFLACRLKEVWIPNSCHLEKWMHFKLNFELEKMHLPDGLEEIPNHLACACLKLREVNIPSTVKTIGYGAFDRCVSLERVDLPDGLTVIDDKSLKDCHSLEELVFPATLEYLGEECCVSLINLKRIYCMAPEPPLCTDSRLNPGTTPFGNSHVIDKGSTSPDIPVYVPVGCAEKYRNAWGWNYFKNIIETEAFPSSIENITMDELELSDSEYNIYDLSGRKVSNPQEGQIYIINGKKVFLVR